MRALSSKNVITTVKKKILRKVNARKNNHHPNKKRLQKISYKTGNNVKQTFVVKNQHWYWTKDSYQNFNGYWLMKHISFICYGSLFTFWEKLKLSFVRTIFFLVYCLGLWVSISFFIDSPFLLLHWTQLSTYLQKEETLILLKDKRKRCDSFLDFTFSMF